MPASSLSQCRSLLGTYVEIHIRADLDEDTLLDRSLAAFEEINRIQSLMSFHDPDSELTQINRSAHLSPVKISREMRQVLSFVIRLCQVSSGYFDPTIAPELVRRGLLPDHGTLTHGFSNWKAILLGEDTVHFSSPLGIDLGGIAKGYAVDRALDVIGHDVDATVNAGGDLAMSRWHSAVVNVRTPGTNGRHTLQLPMENQAIATSAAYFLEGEHVIVDPHDLRPFPGKQSASIFAASCMVADALTKVALLMPDPSAVLRNFGASGLIIGLEGKVKRL